MVIYLIVILWKKLFYLILKDPIESRIKYSNGEYIGEIKNGKKMEKVK
jgi:hypothetical protein